MKCGIIDLVRKCEEVGKNRSNGEVEELKARIAELEKRVEALEEYIEDEKEVYKGFVTEKNR